MNETIYELQHGQVVRRGDRSFVRYDAGSLVNAWREDEITEAEFQRAMDTQGRCTTLSSEFRNTSGLMQTRPTGPRPTPRLPSARSEHLIAAPNGSRFLQEFQ